MSKQEVKQCENYHCSVEQAGESTAQSCLDGKRSAMSSGKATRKKSLPKESKMESSTAPQSSAMSEHSSVKGTPEHIAEWLKSLAVDSHASPSQSQESEQPSDDARNMWPATMDVIREVQPAIVYLENVPGLLSATVDDSAGRSIHYFGTVLRDLAEGGYDCKWTVLGADDVGAAHHRKRLWIRGVRRNAAYTKRG